MSLPALFFVAFATALSGALVPGPMLFATLHRSVRHGRMAGPLIVLGHAIVEVPLMVGVILGLTPLLSAPAFKAGVGITGGAVLLVMGALMAHDATRLTLPTVSDPEDTAASPALSVVVSGAVTSVSNPYFVLWWATIGLNFIVHARPFGALGYSVFYAGHMLADLAWYAAVSESMHHGRRVMSDSAYRWMVGACAVLLMGFGVLFAIAGYRFLGGA